MLAACFLLNDEHRYTTPLKMPATRKRMRAISAEAHSTALPSAAVLRAALAARCDDDSPPGPWQSAAATAGVSGADAFLCHLGRSVVAALQTIPVNAEAARAQLRSTRAGLHSAVDARCDELEAGINDAESSKIAALEHELCTIDAALERLRAERAAAADAARFLGDSELVARNAELAVRLDAVEAQLLALPTSIVALPHVGLAFDASVLLGSIAVIGRVVSPRAITSADLAIRGAPSRVPAGGTLLLRLSLQGTSHASQSTEELEVSLKAACAVVQVEATLEVLKAAPQRLAAHSCANIPGRCVDLSLPVPITAPAGSSVCIRSLAVAGQAAGIASGSLNIPVREGVQAPFRVELAEEYDNPFSLCITQAGQLVVPQGQSVDVSVFDAYGAPLPSIAVAGLGLGTTTRWAAFASASSSAPPTLLIADHTDTSTTIIAMDAASRNVRWEIAGAHQRRIGGMTTLSNHGIAVVSCGGDLVAYSLVDGKKIASGKVQYKSSYFNYLAASSEAVFGSVANDSDDDAPLDEDDIFKVVRYSWTPGFGFATEEVIAAAGQRRVGRPLAVIPPATGRRVSHLVVGAWGEPELLVFALPSLALVHTHSLVGMCVTALGADPWGEAIAVADTSAPAIVVLAWPLSGMPALE